MWILIRLIILIIIRLINIKKICTVGIKIYTAQNKLNFYQKSIFQDL